MKRYLGWGYVASPVYSTSPAWGRVEASRYVAEPILTPGTPGIDSDFDDIPSRLSAHDPALIEILGTGPGGRGIWL